MLATASADYRMSSNSSGFAVDDYVDTSKTAGFSCYFWSGMAYYDITGMQSTTDYRNSSSGTMATWNYCQYASIPQNSHNVTKAFAFLTNMASTEVTPMTDGDVTLDDTEQNTEDKSVTIVQTSNVACAARPNETTKFVTTIVCDKEITAKGGAQLVSADWTSDPCTLKVTMKHDAGCPEIDASGMVAFMHNYPWVLGIVFVICGPVIGMRGRRMFPWMVASLAACITLFGLLLVFTVFGWMTETLGICLSIFFALAGGVGMFFFAKWSISF
jgi:hypothetical protein